MEWANHKKDEVMERGINELYKSGSSFLEYQISLSDESQLLQQNHFYCSMET